MGGKKSTVCTTEISVVSWKTPASSEFSNPTRTPGTFCRGSVFNARSRSPGPSLPAQPADLANSVSLINAFLVEYLPFQKRYQLELLRLHRGAHRPCVFLHRGERRGLYTVRECECRHAPGRWGKPQRGSWRRSCRRTDRGFRFRQL